MSFNDIKDLSPLLAHEANHVAVGGGVRNEPIE